MLVQLVIEIGQPSFYRLRCRDMNVTYDGAVRTGGHQGIVLLSTKLVGVKLFV